MTSYKQQIEEIVQYAYNNGRNSRLKLSEVNSSEILPWMTNEYATTQLLALMDEFGDETYKKGYIDAGIAALQTNDKGE